MTDSEQIGKHKGAVETLMHEKKELSRILQIVNSQLQRHLKGLEDNGVNAEEFLKEIQQTSEGQNRKRKSAQKQSSNRRQQKQSSNRTTNRNKQRKSQNRRSSQKSETSSDDEERLSEDFFE